MAVELNLLNLQAQPEMARKVSSEARKGAPDRSETKTEDFSQLLRELAGKANTKEKSPSQHEESLLAGVLIAFPFLPAETVMKVEEEGTVGVDALPVARTQPILATTPGISFQLDGTVDLSAEGLEETSVELLASSGNGPEIPLATATETVAVPEENVDGTSAAGFSRVTAREQMTAAVFTIGETGTLTPEEPADNRELQGEKSKLFAAWAAGSAGEGEAVPTEAFDLNVADEGINEQPLLTRKEMSQAIPLQEKLTRPVKNSASMEIGLAHSGQKEENAGSTWEQETAASGLASENTPPVTVKRQANEQDTALPHVFEAVFREAGETAETAGHVTSLDEKVPSTLPKAEVLDQILNGARLMVKDEVAKIELHLEPAELGKLELSLVVERDLITARFVAESQGVQSLIEANLSQLRSALQEAGLTVDLLQVDVQTGNEPQLQEHSFTADHRSTPRAPVQNGTDEWLAAEESYFVEDSWHGMVNLRV